MANAPDSGDITLTLADAFDADKLAALVLGHLVERKRLPGGAECNVRFDWKAGTVRVRWPSVPPGRGLRVIQGGKT